MKTKTEIRNKDWYDKQTAKLKKITKEIKFFRAHFIWKKYTREIIECGKQQSNIKINIIIKP